MSDPDPYPRPTTPASSLQEPRWRRDELVQLAARHGASAVRVFGSVAHGDSRSCGDLDVLVDMGDGSSLFKQAALQRELEASLGCPVHVRTTPGSR